MKKTTKYVLEGLGLLCFGLVLLTLMLFFIKEYGVGAWLYEPDTLVFLMGMIFSLPIGLFKIAMWFNRSSSSKAIK